MFRVLQRTLIKAAFLLIAFQVTTLFFSSRCTPYSSLRRAPAPSNPARPIAIFLFFFCFGRPFLILAVHLNESANLAQLLISASVRARPRPDIPLAKEQFFGAVAPGGIAAAADGDGAGGNRPRRRRSHQIRQLYAVSFCFRLFFMQPKMTNQDTHPPPTAVVS